MYRSSGSSLYEVGKLLYLIILSLNFYIGIALVSLVVIKNE